MISIVLEVTFHLRQPMVFSFISLYDTPMPAPHMNVLFWGQGDFQFRKDNNLDSDRGWLGRNSILTDISLFFSFGSSFYLYFLKGKKYGMWKKTFEDKLFKELQNGRILHDKDGSNPVGNALQTFIAMFVAVRSDRGCKWGLAREKNDLFAKLIGLKGVYYLFIYSLFR